MSDVQDTAAGDGADIVTTIAPPPTPRQTPRVFRPIPVRGRFAIPVTGGAGAEDILVKTPGTDVRRGELLVERWPESSAAPLAPADGRIVGLGVAKLTAGHTVPSILFEPATAASEVEPPTPATAGAIALMLERLREMDLAAGIEKLRQHGVLAERWTTPDLLGQLRAAVARPVDTVLCDVLDESPDLLFHHELAMAFPVELVAGVVALGQLTGAKEMWAVLAAFGDPLAWDLLRAAIENTELKLVPLQDHYPQAHPTLLIHEVTGRHSAPGQLPVESGVLALDAAAAVAVGRCFLSGEKMLTVPVGFRQRLSGENHWLEVPIGMPWSHVLAHLSIVESKVEVRAGNPLREVSLSADCVAIGGELTVTATGPQRRLNPDPCIRCAWCVEGCPVRIQPAGLLEAAQQDDPFLADQYGLDACIECGICSYVCPSHLPILAGIRTLRGSNNQ